MSHLPVLAPRLPGYPPPSMERPCSKEHNEAEWNAKRDLIHQLYIGDNRKLSDIMTILETKHAFAATEQMYKKRLKKWNIRKRTYRKNGVASITSPSPATSSNDTELDSSASTNGADAESTSSIDDVDTDSTMVNDAISDTNEDSVEDIPRDALIRRDTLSKVRLSELPSYKALGLVLGSVFSWSNNKLDSGAVRADPMSKYLAHPNQPPLQDSRTMYRTFELVFDLWYHGKGNLAGIAARKGFYALEYVLEEDHPDLIWHVLDTLYDMADKGHLQLLGMFLEHAHALTRRVLPGSHPLSMIIEQLRRCDYQTNQGRQVICHLLRQAWLRNVDLLGDQIGSLGHQRLWLYEQLIWDGRTRLRKNSGLQRKQATMEAALEALAEDLRHDMYEDVEPDRLRVEALKLEFTQMDLGDKEKAERLALALLEHSEGLTMGHARFHAYARKMLARLHEARQDYSNAEHHYRYAIAKREAAHGTMNNLRVVRDMWVLAGHFQQTGRLEEADAVVNDALSRAEKYLHEMPG